MKEGWTYKKLGEVCKVIMGQSPDGESVNDTNGIEFHQGKVFFGEKYLKVSNSFTEQPSKIAEPNSVLLCVRAPVGVVNLTLRRICIGRGLCAIQPNDNIIMPFIYYALTTKQAYFDKNSTGSTFKAISSKIVTNTVIPVPPLAEQERIVTELDLLSGIIDKKKEQLKAYDQLAQSIFYTMFGDPIDNPKGWETKKLKELCKKITDGTHNSPINTEIGDYKYITAKNIKKDGIILNNITYVSTDIHKAIYERCNPEYGDVLYIKDGITTGIATINTLKEEFSLLSSVALLKPKGCLMNYYLKAVLNMPSQYASIREHMGGAAITRLTIAKINEIRIPVPPLSLQEEFAEKVEAIERQKALVQQSIEEMQTMFDYTMDKYFG